MTRNRTRVTDTRKGQTLVKGHTLRDEGKPYWLNVTGIPVLQQRGESWGRGLCSCGVISDNMQSTRARRRWHVEHKADVQAMLTTTAQAAIEQAS